MNKHYILDGHKPIETDLKTWARWIESNKRHVADEIVGDVRISTVFLGWDCSFGVGLPLFFETMVFGGELNGETDQYTTWEEAEVGHRVMVERVKSLKAGKPSG